MVLLQNSVLIAKRCLLQNTGISPSQTPPVQEEQAQLQRDALGYPKITGRGTIPDLHVPKAIAGLFGALTTTAPPADHHLHLIDAGSVSSLNQSQASLCVTAHGESPEVPWKGFR